MDDLTHWYNRSREVSKQIKRVQKALDTGELTIKIEDPTRITYENRHNLSEVELFVLQDQHILPWSYYFAISGFTISYFSAMTYLFFKNKDKITQKLVPKHKMTVGNMALKGSLLAISAMSLYSVITISFVLKVDMLEKHKKSKAVKEEMLKKYLREDEFLQDQYLIQNMDYYGMPEKMKIEAKGILDRRREEMKRDKKLMIYLLDEVEKLDDQKNSNEENSG